MAKRTTSAAAPQPQRTPLNRERILQAALDVADQRGLEALSMRKLAQSLGVKAMSLYNHVANREEIIDGLVDHVVGEIELPAIGEPWKIAMRRRAIAAHAVLLKHPWATLAMMSRMNVGPAMLRYFDVSLGCLLEAGFSLEMADHAYNAIDSHIYGFTLQELNFPIAAADYSATAAEYLSLLPAETHPYAHRLACHVIGGGYDGVHDFEFGLNLILDGLAQLQNEGLET